MKSLRYVSLSLLLISHTPSFMFSPNYPLFIKPHTKHSGLTTSSGLPLPLKVPESCKSYICIFFLTNLSFVNLI